MEEILNIVVVVVIDFGKFVIVGIFCGCELVVKEVEEWDVVFDSEDEW